MSFERSCRENFNFSKRIPLHYKKRYLANISNGSFNATVLTAVYKNKIKTLLKNNKFLALTLENDRAKKEELLAESKANADLIMFSKLKLASMSENLKKVVSVLEETLSLLEMHSSASISKFTQRHTICREEFKEQLKEVSMVAIAEETDSFEYNQSKENMKNRSLRLSAISGNSAETAVPACRRSHPKINAKKSKKRGQPSLKKSKNKSVIKASNRINSSNSLISSPVKEVVVTTFSESKKSSSNKKSLQNTNLSQIKNSKTKKLHINSKCASKNACKTSITSLNKIKKIPRDPKSDLTGKSVSSKNICDINEATVNNDNRSINFTQKISCKNIQKEENNRKNRKSIILNNENVEFDELCFSSIEPANRIYDVSNVVKCSLGAVCNNIGNDYNEKLVLFNSEKENKEVGKLQDLIMKQINSYQVSEQKLSVPQRRKGGKNSVGNLSKIGDLKDKKAKRKSVCQLDDITAVNVSENDICQSFIKKNNSKRNTISGTESLAAVKKIFNKNRKSLSEIDNLLGKPCSAETVHQDEKMVKNAILVAAEIHNTPDLLVEEKTLAPQNYECLPSMQPVVIVEDILKTCKSYCKSILQPSSDEQNSIPLQEELLDHCLALKQVPDESPEAQNKNSINADSDLGISVEQNKNAGHSEAISTLMEPPLSVENEFFEECSNVERRKFRRRSSICYKEHPANVKLRR